MSIIPLPDDEYYNIEIWSIDGIMVGKENWSISKRIWSSAALLITDPIWSIQEFNLDLHDAKLLF
jgi:hypothetical protein